ncbi:MAG: hypothetical protein ACXABY_28465 [Candidatus Thorarchaeota archaeon]|jgi:hypothetical protein
MVAAADSTLVAIRQKVRRLTASPDPTTLSDDDIDKYINTYYSQDFPSAFKLDQLRVVYELFTSPNIERYPVDLNTYQAIRDPIYIEGRQGVLYKDRATFYAQWPRQTTKYTPATGDGATTAFTFTIAGAPLVAGSITIGAIVGGSTVQSNDDTAGNITGGGVTGTVNYVTGVFTSLTYPTAPDNGTSITLWADTYTASRPFDILFWNNEIIVRPIPDNVYRIEVEAFLTPTQFAATGTSPTLNSWWQLLALGAAIKVLQDQQDMEGLENILPWFEEQKGLVLERQAVEQIGFRNNTIYEGGSQESFGFQGGNW